MDRRLRGPQNGPGRYDEAEILAPIGTRSPTPQSCGPQAVATPTELPWLLRYATSITVVNVSCSHEATGIVSCRDKPRRAENVVPTGKGIVSYLDQNTYTSELYLSSFSSVPWGRWRDSACSRPRPVSSDISQLDAAVRSATHNIRTIREPQFSDHCCAVSVRPTRRCLQLNRRT
jgi:hypothetical protein